MVECDICRLATSLYCRMQLAADKSAQALPYNLIQHGEQEYYVQLFITRYFIMLNSERRPGNRARHYQRVGRLSM